MPRRKNSARRVLERFATVIASWAGGSSAFAIAVAIIVIWGATGPMFRFSDTWQLVINTSTTVVTFLMVFLIQRSQNKDALAIQLKLNEIVAAIEGASNRLIDVEDLSEEELDALRVFYRKLALIAKQDRRLTESHSVEEAEAKHKAKAAKRRS